jgi:hypothetical protein
MQDDDFDKPMIAVVNTWSSVTPCNMHLDRLADDVRAGIRAAGGWPVDFNTIETSIQSALCRAPKQVDYPPNLIATECTGHLVVQCVGPSLSTKDRIQYRRCRHRLAAAPMRM